MIASVRKMMLAVIALAAIAGPTEIAAQAMAPAEAVLRLRCGGCHAPLPNGRLARISEQRKAPEGWYMTLFRMKNLHKVQITDEEHGILMKLLSDTQGLAPAETSDYRYALERESHFAEKYNAVDSLDPAGLARRCALCHSFARSALQRRTEDEWRLLVNFHVSQFPATEYLAFNRTTPDYWQSLSSETPKVLAAQYPFETPEWRAWVDMTHKDLSGQWRVVGDLPGVGSYEGIETIARTAPDKYSVSYAINYADGRTDRGEGSAIVYTGYEWRGTVNYRSDRVREVYAVTPDGNQMQGRWFRLEHDELGARSRAVRIQSGVSRVLSVDPAYVRAGEHKRLVIIGTNLVGPIDLGSGVVAKVLERDPMRVVVDATAVSEATAGARTVTVGDAHAESAVVVYRTLDSLRVEPPFAMCRAGDGGGKIAAVSAQFDAVGYLNGPDGIPGTPDDIRVGVFPAAWALEPYDEVAKRREDEKYAGKITPNGLFVAPPGGSDRTRPHGVLNPSGDLSVRATTDDSGRSLSGLGHVVVSASPLYVNPPIR